MRYSSYERPLTLFDIFASIFRYKWRVALVTCLMFVLCVCTIFLFPKKYESEAKLFVRLGRGSASMDPATVGQTISIQESRESEMNSIVDMLQSRGLAERIVDQIGQERVLKKYAWVEVTAKQWSDYLSEVLQKNMPALQQANAEGGEPAGDELDRKKEYELAVKELMSNLKIDSPKKSTTISVAYRGRTPKLAFDVVDAVLAAYQQMHIEAYRSGGTLDFFGQQFDEQENLVAENEDLLRQAKNENAVVTMKGKQESLQTEMTEVKKMQLEAQAALRAALARVAKLQTDLQELPKELLSERTQGIADNATDSMRDRLYSLEIQEKELSAKYQASHPELQKVREQLRSAREIVDEQPDEREQTVVAINPIRMDIENEVLLAEATAASLQAKVDTLGTLEQGLVRRLNAVNNLEVMTHEMQRKIDIARENHLSYARKLEESRINAALDAQTLSNVSIVAKPTLRYKHASPRRSILTVLGALLSLLCGVAVALICDYSAGAKEINKIREAERKRYLRELESDVENAVIANKYLAIESAVSEPDESSSGGQGQAQEQPSAPKKAR